MEVILIIAALILAISGLVGTIVPGIPGPPFGFLAVLILSFTKVVSYSYFFLIVLAVLAIIVTVLDYCVPAWGIKKLGGTEKGIRGSNIGVALGIMTALIISFVGVLGILLGPFLGAYLGERSAGIPGKKAWRAAFGSFMGFLAGTAVKTIYAIFILFLVIKDIILVLF